MLPVRWNHTTPDGTPWCFDGQFYRITGALQTGRARWYCFTADELTVLSRGDTVDTPGYEPLELSHIRWTWVDGWLRDSYEGLVQLPWCTFDELRQLAPCRLPTTTPHPLITPTVGALLLDRVDDLLLDAIPPLLDTGTAVTPSMNAGGPFTVKLEAAGGLSYDHAFYDIPHHALHQAFVACTLPTPEAL